MTHLLRRPTRQALVLPRLAARLLAASFLALAMTSASRPAHADTMKTWGSGSSGEMGDGTFNSRYTPGTGGVANSISFSAGENHFVAVKSDGTVWTWGNNGYGQLGDNTTTNRSTPVQVKDTAGTGFLTGVKSVVASPEGCYAVKTDGTVWAWGYNASGELGDGTTNFRYTPVQVKGAGGTGFLTGVSAVDAEWNHALALKSDGTVWAWGANESGQLGDGTTTSRSTPVQVKDTAGTGFLTGMTSIGAGISNSYAVKNDGTLWGWGNGSYIGNGGSSSSTPVQVTALTGVATVIGGYQFAIAIKTDGSVWSWGGTGNGELGNGTSGTSSTPVQVKGVGGTGFLSGVKKIDAGRFHIIAVKTDGSVVAWGYNYFGQLGLGDTTIRTVPTLITGLTASDVAAGYVQSGALFISTPTANAQSLTTTQNVAKNFTLTGSDPASLPLTYQVPTTTVAGGTLTVNGTSPNYTYTPPSASFLGNDSFTFTVTNTNATSNVSTAATVSITVEETPLSVVTTSSDVVSTTDGKTSLREAINKVNSTSGNDTITFGILDAPVGGLFTIQPTSANGPLPTLSDPLGTVINATTQTGGTVVLDGTLLGAAGTRGLQLTGSDGSITGLTIQNFQGAGISVTGASSLRNTLRGNTFKGNTGLSIDLNGDGATTNDSLDPDNGPNGLQNKPVITTCAQQNANTVVTATLNSNASTPFVIDLYLQASGTQSQVTSANVTTDTNGDATTTFTLSGSFAGQTFSALATKQTSIAPVQDQDSSEFSAGVTPAYITSFSPTSGGPNTSVIITGAGFTGATGVLFGSTSGTGVVVNSDTQITVTNPNTSGAVTVITASKGNAISSAAFVYTGLPPSGMSIDPIVAKPGDVIEITGSNLTYATGVTFAGGATGTGFRADGPGQIVVTVPETALTGTLIVQSSAGPGTTTDTLKILPRIDSFTPLTGPVATSVTITGAGFTGATKARFSAANNGFVDATNFVVVSNTSITCKVPSGAIDGAIRVVNAYGNTTTSGIGSGKFDVQDASGPSITSFSPTSGPVGSRVKIYGRNFTSIGSVKLGTTPMVFNVISDTQINATIPNIAVAPYTIYVGAVANTSGLTPSQFTVTRAPYINSFTPAQGVVDDAISLTGANFTTTSDVQFAASPDGTFTSTGFVANSSTSMSVFVPDGAKTGYIKVINPFGSTTTTVEFIVKPVITSFTPATCSLAQITSGTVVTITGQSFKSFVKKVKFGVTGSFAGLSAGTKQTNPATPYTNAQLIALGGFVVDSNTQIRAVVPQGLSTGVGKIRLNYQAGLDATTAPTQNADSTQNFTVTATKPALGQSASSARKG